MKIKISSLFVIAVSAFASFSLSSLYAEENISWVKVKNPGEIIPAKGEYAVLLLSSVAKDPEWKKVAIDFANRYQANVYEWNKNILAELKKVQPRYVAIFSKPEEMGRMFIADAHRMMRRLNDDIYGDCLWGVMTARTVEDLKEFSRKEEPLLLKNGFGTTNFDQGRFNESFFVTDWGACEYIETKNYKMSEKITIPNPDDVIKIFGERWKQLQPQYILTASHATEFNLEMPFSKGRIMPAGGEIVLIPNKYMGFYGQGINKPQVVKKFAKDYKLSTLPESKNSKIWIAAGNCLIGNVAKSSDSMAVTLISDYGVKQFVGYTVPSWFGEGGWGTHLRFFNNHQDASVGQAWFFNNQRIIKRLPKEIASEKCDFVMSEKISDHLSPGFLAQKIGGVNVKVTQQNIGRLHDRDVVAFYGDPLYRAKFNPNAPSMVPWTYQLFTDKQNSKHKIVSVVSTHKKDQKSIFNYWFPERRDVKSPIIISIDKKPIDLEKYQAIVTDNFVMLENLELKSNQVLTIEYIVK